MVPEIGRIGEGLATRLARDGPYAVTAETTNVVSTAGLLLHMKT